MKNKINEIIRVVEGWNASDLERLQSELESIIYTRCTDCGWLHCNCIDNELYQQCLKNGM